MARSSRCIRFNGDVVNLLDTHRVPQHNKAKTDEKWLKANYGTSTKAALVRPPVHFC
jgi:hypothetical protein